MAGLLALLLALAALRPLALPDEGRYGEVGRWMALSGDWLVPRLDGMPFFHKPPYLYWLEAASVTVFGDTPWALRLVPALHAALMLVALYLAARAFGQYSCARLVPSANPLAGGASGGAPRVAPDGGERLARRAALMLGCSPTFLLGGQYINHDMLVATWISVAIWCFATAFLRGDKPHTGWALAGFAACALGVLSKGLIGLALPGLVLLIWLLWTRQFRKVWRLPWLRGLLLLAVIAVPWFVLAGQRYPGMLAYLFGVQQFTRYVGSGFNNVRPWWFYLPCLAGLLFPWVIFALGQGVAQIRQRARRHAPAAAPDSASHAPVPREALSLCWIWIAAILAFFSIPHSKLLGYILPAVPPLALLAAVGWGRLASRHADKWLATLVALTLVAICVANIVAGRYTSRSLIGTRDIALTLTCAAAPDAPVYAFGGYPYDLPFLARRTAPLIVAQDWEHLRATTGDNWRRELLEAGDFEPALAARLLQSPADALTAARATPNAWAVAPNGSEAAATLLHNRFRPVTQGQHWTLYASPAMPTDAPKSECRPAGTDGI